MNFDNLRGSQGCKKDKETRMERLQDTIDRSMNPHVFGKIVKFINEIHYGEVVVTIHDSKIVQLEKREKTRL